jgi:nucleotide-binding universal stress UspA family protein
VEQGLARVGAPDDGQDRNRARGRVVVGVDDSAGGRSALVWALRTAASRGARLEVVAAFPVDYSWTDAYLLDPRRIDATRRGTEARIRAMVVEARSEAGAAAGAGAGSVDVEEVVVAGAAAEHLVDRSRGADLLVVGSRGRGALPGALLGSVSLRCVMHAHCPVVVVHEQEPAAAENGPPTVVVGVDGSPASRAALDVAAREARHRGARMEVVVAYRLADTWNDVEEVTSVPAEELRRRVEATVSADVSEVLGAGGAPDRPRVDIVVVEGSPADVLVRRAEGADLLVVGSRGQGTLPGLVLGSVALRVVVRARCPVLVVRPSARAEQSSAAQQEGLASAPVG